MATIQSLAPEILIDIFELAHDPHTPSTMKSASLVCRAWRDAAQRALFLDIAWSVDGAWNPQSKCAKALARSWEIHRSVALHPPRRAELLGLVGVGPGHPALQGLSGVKDLIITGGSIKENFLEDEHLRGLERLTLRGDPPYERKRAPEYLPPPAWPESLRILRVNSASLYRLLRPYQIPSGQVSLTLHIMGWPHPFTPFAGPIPITQSIPTGLLNLSIILSVPNSLGSDLRSFFATAQNVHHLTFLHNASLRPPRSTQEMTNSSETQPMHAPILDYLHSIVGCLPATLIRLTIRNVVISPDVGPAPPDIPLSHIQKLFSNDRLPNLARLDFPDCKREDLEASLAAADLLAECERRSIRVVCWEEFL